MSSGALDLRAQGRLYERDRARLIEAILTSGRRSIVHIREIERKDLIAAERELCVGAAVVVAEFDFEGIAPKQFDDSPNLTGEKVFLR